MTPLHAFLGVILTLRVLRPRSAVIGLYVSYVTPIFLRITSGRKRLQPGPFSLGKWYMPIGIVAVAWVSFITVLLMFPPEIHPTAETMSTSSQPPSIMPLHLPWSRD